MYYLAFVCLEGIRMMCTIINIIIIIIIKHVITVTSICICCVTFVCPSLSLIVKFYKSCYHVRY